MYVMCLFQCPLYRIVPVRFKTTEYNVPRLYYFAPCYPRLLLNFGIFPDYLEMKVVYSIRIQAIDVLKELGAG
jgi:hypothetical protein